MSARWAAPLLLGAALASPTGCLARADVNDVLFGAIQALCLDQRGSVDGAANAALKLPFRARDLGSDAGPPFVREVGFAALGTGATVVGFAGPSRKAPVSECRFVSYSDDLAALLPRLKAAFALAEPTQRSVDQWWEASGRAIAGGRAATVRLEYGLQDNQHAGAFTLTVSR